MCQVKLLQKGESLMDAIVWLILLCLFILIEIATLGLTTIWFAGGALLAFFAALLEASLGIQLTIFFSLSLILLIFTRPVAMRYFNKDRIATNTEGLIGQEATVTQTINNANSEGTVIVNGLEWTARAANNDIIEAGVVVHIVKINGVKAIVEREVRIS